jgi:hypothetical protein
MQLLFQAVVAAAPSLDWTLHVSDVVMFLGGLIAFLRIFMTTRDSLRDMTKAIGTYEPPMGLVGDVREVRAQVYKHHEWLIRDGVDRRTFEERREHRREPPS